MNRAFNKGTVLEKKPDDVASGSVPAMLEPSFIYDPPCGEGKYILTPPESLVPRIHGPSVFGVRPGSPFLFSIPATGERPLRFSVSDLPDGLQLNRETGVISGIISSAEKCTYEVILRAENVRAKSEKSFSIVVGDTICLTPPLGWNSWNCWKDRVNQKNVLDSARAMVDKGLQNYGWSFVNVDDSWQGHRGGPFNAIQPDVEKFPDIKSMCDKIHAMGLKVGIYSSPWITTYAGRVGGSSDQADGFWEKKIHVGPSAQTKKAQFRVGSCFFDTNDVAQWEEWGIDYLKYDWRPNDPESTQRMADALRNCGRDMVYSLSNAAPLEHAELYGREANCWRTAGDLKDRWNEDGSHLNLREQWALHRSWIENGVRGGPGHFPDADMLVIGDLVTSAVGGEFPVPSRLEVDEQYSHLTLWVLWACPLLIGCPVETMDDFTRSLLTNAEVLNVHQDGVAVPGTSVRISDQIEIVVKDLEDGGKAIGLFNTGEKPTVITLQWEEAGLAGQKKIRDLWRQQDIGIAENCFSARVRPHGVVLIRAD